MRQRALVLLLAATAAATAAAPASAQVRQPSAGRVFDRHGFPLAGAEVTFVGSAAPLGDRFGRVDHVVALTNDRGRFRVELLVGHEYDCWAASAADFEGARHVSEVVHGVRSGQGFEFTAVDRRSASRLVVGGEQRWQELGPLRYEVAVGVAHVHRVPLTFSDGVATLPVLPASTTWLVYAIDASDTLLYAAQLPAQPGQVRFSLPAPREIAVRVVDAAGAPVAGAGVWVEVGARMYRRNDGVPTAAPRLARWRRAATTAADGTATALVPLQEDPFTRMREPLLLASAPGHIAALSGWNGQLIVDGMVHQPLPDRVLPFTLREGTPLHGTVRDRAGQPVAGADLAIAGQLLLRHGRNALGSPSEFRARTGADGGFVFATLPDELQAASLLVDVPHQLATRGLSVSTPALRPPARQAQLDLDLGLLPELTLDVQDLDGGPARGAEVLLLPLPWDGRQPDAQTHRFRLDATGRGRTRAQPGDWAVFVTDGLGWSLQVVDFPLDNSLRLPLQPFARLLGHVTRKAASNVSPVRFSIGVTQHEGPIPSPQVAALRAVGKWVNDRLLATTTVAADGTFTLRFLDVPGTSYKGNVSDAGGHAELLLRATDERVEFDLRQ